ncbi:MAG: hypothetical protein HY815_11470 [Candidatus Riflebacteria bacterium]|nr:hypothetical protein [Candidatus Riflebacteria bacterium]
MSQQAFAMVILAAFLQTVAQAGPKMAPRGPSPSFKSYRTTMTLGDGRKLVSVTKLDDGQVVKVKSYAADGGWSLADVGSRTVHVRSPGKPAIVQKKAWSLHALQFPLEDPRAEPLPIHTHIDLSVSDDICDGIPCRVHHNKTDRVRDWRAKSTNLTVKYERDGRFATYSHDLVDSVPDSEFELPAGVPVEVEQTGGR